MPRRQLLIVLLAVVGLLAAGAVHFALDQLLWVDTPGYEGVAPGEARTLVVHYSRTGNTLGAASEVARHFGADMLRIDAPEYPLTLDGQTLAAKHADERLRTTPIEHDPVDMARYDLVVLCSPTWWYRPAVPLWSFAETVDFAGKPVFLVMTGNSRRKDEHTAEFGDLVQERGGVFLDSIFLRRGRFLWQKSSEQLAREVREELEAREGSWPETARHR